MSPFSPIARRVAFAAAVLGALPLLGCSGDDPSSSAVATATTVAATNGPAPSVTLPTGGPATSVTPPAAASDTTGATAPAAVAPIGATPVGATPAGPSMTGAMDGGAATSTTAATAISLPPAAIGLPAIPPFNQARQPITLDETALLACANTQFAWVALQQGDSSSARVELSTAAQRATVSAVTEVSSVAPTLQRAATGSETAAAVESFLSICRSRGFES